MVSLWSETEKKIDMYFSYKMMFFIWHQVELTKWLFWDNSLSQCDLCCWPTPLDLQALVFTCLQYKSLINTVGKGEIAHNKQFLLFPQCFLPVWRTFCHFHHAQNSSLQTLSIWNSLKFVIWERVKVSSCAKFFWNPTINTEFIIQTDRLTHAHIPKCYCVDYILLTSSWLDENDRLASKKLLFRHIFQ